MRYAMSTSEKVPILWISFEKSVEYTRQNSHIFVQYTRQKTYLDVVYIRQNKMDDRVYKHITKAI
jgi:hypothetical protein